MMSVAQSPKKKKLTFPSWENVFTHSNSTNNIINIECSCAMARLAVCVWLSSSPPLVLNSRKSHMFSLRLDWLRYWRPDQLNLVQKEERLTTRPAAPGLFKSTLLYTLTVSLSYLCDINAILSIALVKEERKKIHAYPCIFMNQF